MAKQILFFCIALLGLTFSHLTLSAQKVKPEEVPDGVKQALLFENPAAKVSAWVLEGEEYVATFKEDGASGKAYFKPEGEWVKTIFSVPKKQLPPLLHDYIAVNYPDFSYAFTELRYVPDERLHYYIELKPAGLSGTNSILTFSDNGELLTREDPPDFTEPVRENEKASLLLAEKEKSKNKKVRDASDYDYSEPEPEPEPVPEPQQKKQKQVQTREIEQDFEEDIEQEKAQKQERKRVEKTEREESENRYERYDEMAGEQISSSKVPEPVKKEFGKKIPRPEELSWYGVDTFFVAKSIYKEQKNEVFIARNGKWVKTYTELPESVVSGNILKHLNSFHSGWKFKTAVKEARADKEDRLLVEVYEKANRKQKLSTALLFDKAGKLIITFDPEYDPIEGKSKKDKEEEGLEKYYQKMSINVAEERAIEIPEAVENAFKAKYPKIKTPQWSEDGDNYNATYMGTRGKEIVVIGQAGTLLQTQVAGNLASISDAIKSHVKKSYKGFQIDEFFSVRDIPAKKNLYKVVIKNKKTGSTQDLWFNTSGKSIDDF